MIYLIGNLSIWLLLTAAFAGLAGWAYAAQRAAPQEQALRREREHLLADIARFAGGEPTQDVAANERELDGLRRLIEVRDSRIAELEQSLESARRNADEAAGRIAELERAPAPAPAELEETSRLRALVAEHEAARAREVEVEASPVEEDQSAALQGWRLRYFEQRVRYLEGLAASETQAPAQEEAAPPISEWRAREASARAAFLENSLREALSQPAAAAADAAPFAADAEVDMLMRWRLLYLERRVAHLQERLASQEAAAPEPSPPAEPALDPDRWRWRARYLEARIRHLEQRAVSPMAAPGQPVEEEAPHPIAAPPAPEPPAIRPQRPETLPAARNGAPDDFTLIEDVSVLQQTTLYSIGVFHFDQIAAWTPANVAWVDQYLRLRGRIEDEEWVAQARDLAERGVHASRRSRAPAEA